MIAIDTSALIAIALREPGWEACLNVVNAEPRIIISAVNLAETLVVGEHRGVAGTMKSFLDAFSFEVIEVNAGTAQRVAEIYARWGKGRHPARLNFADCFAYDVAMTRDCPLLFVGEDFSRTDITSALG